MIKIFSLLFVVSFVFADTLPLPQLNPKTGKWEYVDDGKQSKPSRLVAVNIDAQNGVPADLFDSQNYGDLSHYGKLGTISVSISGGTMEFLGKRRKYSPIQKLITLGESGSFKVYCYEADCRNDAPEPLYYSYRINQGALELFIDSVADSPIRILVDNSILKHNKTVENISVNQQNSALKPSGITVQLLGIGAH